MHFSQVFSSVLLLLTSAIAAPIEERNTCTTLAVRKEWRTLSKAERLEYVGAVKCLMAKPAQTGAFFAGAKTRYDDFLALHINSTDYVHFNGPFLPWHRWLLHLWETELRTTCGYKGYQPWWDLLQDNTIGGYAKSPLFDNTYGLGGNGPYIADVSSNITFPVQTPTVIPGRTGGGCVEVGPFANMTINMGMGLDLSYNPHCMRRDFSPTLVAEAFSNAYYEAALASENFQELNQNIQGYSFEISGMRLHAALHIGVGGQVGDEADMWSSPGDPIFWFIHASLDRLWNNWQRECWETRQSEIMGPDTIFAYPFDFFGEIPYTNITLDYELEYEHFGSNVRIGDIMDVEAPNLCYTYE
ncbi:Di-copper centre-containing protein [Mollisia scopiformis]|uniref:Di-copper centre-containing protein n=1 Tax=Mollisia scopiformis TaxID=149040 RepID=A0A194XAS3_MOLSC|nr:Di-copper centre-containing protein [Mollisia scopiformis]KUJ17276.1 Di-copper centre-containing protein [Mollisia scopiformis]